ncbi:rod shape-determining protein MreD [Amphibacillus sediminis]|uniref:rod shape-determining protein MreD n=1 Tax=Amphibacillus sediminis TaxID=360185 RepID=UPI00082AA9E6|nr:rod shape-determining protein MreD [Amphibacillus sediminis]
MSRIAPPLILLLLLILQGGVSLLIPASISEAGLIIVIHSVFLFLLLLVMFYDLEDTYYALFFAILSGLLIDIVYTSIIGVYMFSYAIITYFFHGMRKLLHANFYVALILMIIGVGLVDSLLYFIYQFIGVTNMGIADYLSHRLMPTLFVNLLVFLIFYLIFKRKLVKWSNDRFDPKRSTN